jgi:nucleoside-diphosphate-sugar epimerase
MNAVVTGVAGFIGSHLAERLLDDGATVIGVDCFTDYYPRELKNANLALLLGQPKFRLVETSIQDAQWSQLLVDITHVFHLAAQAGVRKSWGSDFKIYTTCNIESTQILLEACISAKLKRFVYASSSSVYGDAATLPMHEDANLHPLSPYGVTKLAAEHLCYSYLVNHGLPTVSLRYFTVYGPRQRPDMAFNRFLQAILGGRPITLYGDGEQTRDFTFVADAVTATLAAGNMGIPGRVYNIGGGARISINDVIKLMAQCTGRTAEVRRQDQQKGDMRDTYADTSLAAADLGFDPSVTLEQGIEAEYRWLSTTLALT